MQPRSAETSLHRLERLHNVHFPLRMPRIYTIDSDQRGPRTRPHLTHIICSGFLLVPKVRKVLEKQRPHRVACHLPGEHRGYCTPPAFHGGPWQGPRLLDWNSLPPRTVEYLVASYLLSRSSSSRKVLRNPESRSNFEIPVAFFF